MVNDEDKIHWMGFMHPNNGVRREQTLRKPYIHMVCDHQQIDHLLEAIKPYGLTLKWKDEPERTKNTDFASMFNELNQYKNRNFG
ncbi:hypothetical protein FXN59_10780 [Aggregatibacter actinomycetemcomitans]|nr:hypothetical protein FXN59_10780 [Aggregatibacter actinomycetemcomitans]TYA49471.1 hypothetical protein FXB74_04225 [Aggregatibacter actinomycetemcomitans]